MNAAQERKTRFSGRAALAAGLLVRRVARLWRHGLALGAGALLACAFAPQQWWPLAFISPAILILLWEQASARQAAWLGFWFGFGLFAAGTYWLYVSLNLMAPVWLTLLLMFALIGLMALYHALTGYAVVRFFPAGPVRWLLAAPSIWLLVEWLRGWLFSGFPWLSIGYTQTGTALAHLAPVGGVYGIGLVVLLGAGALVALVRGTRRVRIAAAAILLAPWLAATALGDVVWTHPSGPPVSVAIVQGNVSEQDKLSGAHTHRILMRYQRLTEAAFGARLIVWPESSLPGLINNMFPYVERLDIAARRHGSALVMGVLRESSAGKYYNSILALGRRVSWYSKRHLVPFAEYFPVPRFVRRWLQEMNLPYSSFTPGPARQRPLPVAGLELGPTVCYEVAYGGYMLRMLPKANVLVNVSDDAWFGNTSARYQQFQMAQMRTQEEGRYMIVSTDNGVSGVIGPRGQVLAEAPILRPYVLRSTVTPLQGMTLFARLGNGLAVTLAALALAAASALRLAGNRRTMRRP